MKNRAKQITFDTPVAPPRFVMFLDRDDGTFNVFEDDEKTLRAYRPRRGERVSIHRAFVRRAP